MNLDGFALLARVAELSGIDVWQGLTHPIEYLTPFVIDPSKWTKPQISPVDRNRGYFLGLAGLHYKRRDWIDAQVRFGLPSNTWGVLMDSLLRAAT
jgi:hypothetical protein